MGIITNAGQEYLQARLLLGEDELHEIRRKAIRRVQEERKTRAFFGWDGDRPVRNLLNSALHVSPYRGTRVVSGLCPGDHGPVHTNYSGTAWRCPWCGIDRPAVIGNDREGGQ